MPDEGLKAEMAGEWKQAIAIYEQWLERDEKRADLWRRIAQIRIHIKDIPGAIDALKRSLEVEPGNASTHFDLATLLSMERKPEAAIHHAEKAKQLEPDNVKYLRMHGQLANWLKRFSEAADSYRRIYEFHPDDESALRDLANSLSWAGEHAKAADLYQRYLERHPESTFLWLALSREKSKLDDVAGAEKALLRAAEVEPENAEVQAALSRFYAMRDKPEKALVHARRALKGEPGNVEYLRAHAQIANWAKRPAEAAVSLEKLLARFPGDNQIIDTLARTYQWAGMPDKATALYEQVLRERPNDLKLWLKVVDGKVAQNKREEAVSLLEQAYAKFLSRSKSRDESQPRREGKKRVPILLYHCIGDSADNDYWIAADEFAAQMAELSRLGYRSVTSRDVELYLFGGKELPPKPVMITFDDACHNLYTHAWPILKRYGFTADIYIFTDAIRGDAAQRASIVQHRHGKDTLLDYMIWPEIEAMVADGFVIGAHSKSHADMKTLDEEGLKLEILYSKLKILAETGIDVTSFSYPFGSGFHRDETHRILRSAGFRVAFAAHGGVADLGRDDPMEIPRIEIWGPNPNSDPDSAGILVNPGPERPYDRFRNRVEPNEAEIHYERSRLYAMAEDPERAYQEIEKALALDPDNRRYLRDMTQLANWTNRHARAVEGYQRLSQLGEEDDQLLLNQARVSSYAGKLDESANYYERYLQRHPEHREAALERIRVESWRENSGKAMKLLERYRERFGEDDAWLKVKVDILSWGGYPRKTEKLIASRLNEEPDDYQLNFARVLAAHFGGRPRDALDGLRMMEERFPENEDNRMLHRLVEGSRRPRLSFDSSYVTSSEDLQALSTALQGSHPVTPELEIKLGYVQEWFSAELGSGLEAMDGSSGAQYRSLRAGIHYRFSPGMAMELHAGEAEAEGGETFVSGVDMILDPADGLNLHLQYGKDYFHEYYSSSPKTISLNIEEESTRVYLNWKPNFDYRLNAQAAHSRFSDGNSSRFLQLALRRAAIRRQYWNADMGLYSVLLDFSEKKDHGYYEPDNYQRYMLLGEAYWKGGDGKGIFFSLALGAAKDESMDAFKFASEGGISGEFELDADWSFRFGITAVHNVTRGGGAYTGNGINLSIHRRF